jgi:hypothetical protein
MRVNNDTGAAWIGGAGMRGADGVLVTTTGSARQPANNKSDNNPKKIQDLFMESTSHYGQHPQAMIPEVAKCVDYRNSINSISNIKVALGGTRPPPAPVSP